MATKLKDPVRNINQEILHSLELVSSKVYPLIGGSVRRPAEHDPRLPNLVPTTSIAAASDQITLYEHIATIRDWKANKFFVAFRQTMDALLLEQRDPAKYPEWLMKDPVKQTELKVFIYQVTQNPKKMAHINNHEDWLQHIADTGLFDALAYFLLKHHVIDEKMYGRI